jgi:hypothetical protein
MIGRENLAAVRPPILDKSGRKPAEKKYYLKKYEFSHDLLAWVLPESGVHRYVAQI